jgi:hypothetical protein
MTAMHTDTPITGRDIRSDNFKGLTAGKLRRSEQLVMSAVLQAHAQRQRDLSLNEICLVMEKQQLGKRITPNAISGRVTSLVDSGRLARGPVRACSVTGAKCAPVFAVARQADLSLALAKPDIPPATRAGANVDRPAAQVSPQANATRSSGMPPEVRAYIAARKAEAAAQGRR